MKTPTFNCDGKNALDPSQFLLKKPFCNFKKSVEFQRPVNKD